MKYRVEILTIITAICLPLVTFAQESGPGMADSFRSEGKIWVVVAVIAAIFAGISLYLFALDRRLSALEKQEGKKKV